MIVLGASGAALNVLDVARSLGVVIDALVDETGDASEARHVFGVPVVSRLEDAVARSRSGELAIAIGDNHQRSQVVERLRRDWAELRFATLIHPDATVSTEASVGTGTIVLAGCRIAARVRVGEFVHLATNTTIAHECVIGDFVAINSGATLAGRVRVGDRAMVGMNAAVREKGTIGVDAILGAISFANRDILDNEVAAGLPARTLRMRQRDDRYLR